MPDLLSHLTPLDYLLVGVTIATLLMLNGPWMRRSPLWSVTITPLASIIGSGFLVVAPLLRDIAGPLAAAAMLLIVVLAWLIGAVIRYNIAHAEPLLAQPRTVPLIAHVDRVASFALSFAYVISVAFYVSLLAAYLLEPMGLKNDWSARALTTLILAFIGLVGFFRGLHGLEWLEKFTVALKLAVITALLLGLAVFDAGHPFVFPSPNDGIDTLEKWRMLAGTLLVVQGFETVRYMGQSYSAELRICGMKLAQLISGLIYVGFIALITPLLIHLQPGVVDETALIQLTRYVAWSMPAILIVGAVMAQFSAAIADTAGAGGLLLEETGGRLQQKFTYPVVIALAIALVWNANIFEIITYASQAFAGYYFLQAVIALHVASRRGERLRWLGFAAMAATLLAVTLFARSVG